MMKKEREMRESKERKGSKIWEKKKKKSKKACFADKKPKLYGKGPHLI